MTGGRRIACQDLENLADYALGTMVDWHKSIMHEVRMMDLDVDARQFTQAWRAGSQRCNRDLSIKPGSKGTYGELGNQVRGL